MKAKIKGLCRPIYMKVVPKAFENRHIKRILKIGKIHSVSDFKEFVIQFIKFGSVGILNTAISQAVYYIFLVINERLYLVGALVGFVISVLNSYFWNNKYVFEKTQDGHFKSILKTFLAYGSTALLSIGILYLLVDFGGVSKYFANLLALVITIPLNFLINKFWAFK